MNQSQTIAVDIVLLPPREAMEQIIAINKNTPAWGPLALDDYLPHLSLAIGCIAKERMGELREAVASITRGFSPIPVALFEICFVERSSGGKNYALRAQKTRELQKLHEDLMRGLTGLFSEDAARASVYADPGEEVSEPDYVADFGAQYSFASFDPHVTLRNKEEPACELPIAFTASDVTACHIGEMVTCRKKLFSVPLG